jgi:hypothetical protein
VLRNSALIFQRAAAISAFAAVAAGCSSSGIPTGNSAASYGALANGHGAHSRAPHNDARGWISADAKKKKGKHLIYWGNFDTSTIAIYSSKGVNGKEEGQITTGVSEPERLFVDKQYNVYSTNIGNDTITAYHPGQTTPFLTISDGVNSPTGLTVDAAGTVYCANVGNNTVTVYPKGVTTPSLTIPSSSPEYLATDAKDNLYVSSGDGILEYAPGSTSGTNLNLPGGGDAIEVDKKGNVIVINGGEIEYFPKGSTQPSNEIPVSGSPFALSLSGNEKQLYVSSEVSVPFVIQNVAYPKGTALSNKLTTGAGLWPLAVSPDNALGK